LRSHKIKNSERNEEIKEARRKERERNEFAAKDEEIHRNEETRPFTVLERRGKGTSRDGAKSSIHNIRMVGGERGGEWRGMTRARHAMTP